MCVKVPDPRRTKPTMGNGKRNTRKGERGTENIERGKGRRKFRMGNGEL